MMVIRNLTRIAKAEGFFHIAWRGEYQLDYKIPGKLRQYYPTAQWEVYAEKYPSQLKCFMTTVPRHVS